MAGIAHGNKIMKGDVWRLGSGTWSVVSLMDNKVGLSGPLPCRGMQLITYEELLDNGTLEQRVPVTHKLVVLSDGETYEVLGEARVVEVTEEEYERILDGEKVRHVTDLDKRGHVIG